MKSDDEKNDLEGGQIMTNEDEIIPLAKNDMASTSKRVNTGNTQNGDNVKKSTRKLKRIRRRQVKATDSPFIKYGSLFLLVAQLVGLVMLMRYSRTHTDGEDLYFSSTAVFCMEVLKFIACNFVVFMTSGYRPKAWICEVKEHLLNSPFEVLKVSVPSFLYVIQNNLLYLALTNLDAATYQVCYQLKILTTALFSATMLRRKFTATKWAALVILTIGVAIVQTSGESPKSDQGDDQNRSLGLFAILCAACTSGFSGVYFERILKGSSISLWIRNIQMGAPSIVLSLLTVYIQDGNAIRGKGFFVGYSPTVWTVIIVQAIGGLIVAVVVKYADNVLKTFASSFGIVISCIVSSILFGQSYNSAFVVGASLVVFSTVLYSKPERRQRKRLKKSLLPK